MAQPEQITTETMVDWRFIQSLHLIKPVLYTLMVVGTIWAVVTIASIPRG